jgi:hypothetical protein
MEAQALLHEVNAHLCARSSAGAWEMEEIIESYPVLIFISSWIAISILSSKLSGWQRLVRYYRADSPFDGVRFRFQSVGMRFGTNYSGCVTVGVNRTGLHLSVLFLFRIGHPPLFIPWRDVTMTERKKFFMRQVVFQFARCPTIPFIITKRLADKIAKAQGADGCR